MRRVRVAEPGTLREVIDLAEVALQSPLDISRPLWTATLIEGLAGGRAAMMVHLSHAVTDGVGGVEMFANIYDLERDPPPETAPPLPIPQDLSPNDLMRQGFNRLPGAIAGGVRDAIYGAAQAVGSVIRDPVSSVGSAVDYAMSGARVMGAAAEPSPVLRRRSLSSRSDAIDIVFGDLHRAAKAAGGSINDAYLAGLCGALRLYHEAMGIPIDTLPMAIPVNMRSDNDPAGGNRFAGVNLAAPIGIVDPEKRIKSIRSQMTRKRDERAMNMVGVIAPVLSLLPDSVLEGVAGSVRELRCAGQQCAGLPRRHLHRGREDPPAVRTWPAARRGDDGRADIAGGLHHGHHALRPRGGDGRRSLRPVPASRIRRSACARRRRTFRTCVIHARHRRAQSSITERK